MANDGFAKINVLRSACDGFLMLLLVMQAYLAMSGEAGSVQVLLG